MIDLLIALLVAGLLLLSIFGFGWWWRQRQRRLLRDRPAADLEKERLSVRLGLLMRYAKDVILLGDANIRLVDANDQATAAYGWSREELLNMGVEDFRAPEAMEDLPLILDRVNTTGNATYETVHRRRDGTTFPVEVTAQRVELDGQIHTLCVVRDITERRKQQQRIAQLGRMYRVLSRINEVIFRAVGKNELFPQACQAIVESGDFYGTWIGWFDASTRTIKPVAQYGDTQNQVPGSVISVDDEIKGGGTGGRAFREQQTQVCDDILADMSMNPWRERVEAAGVRSSVAVPIREGGEVRGLLMVYDRTKGCFGPEEVTLLEEAAANLSFAVDMFAERERQRSIEEHYRLIAENTSDVIWLGSAVTERFVYISPAITRARGFAPEEMVDGIIGQFSLPETRGRVREELRRRIDGFNRGDSSFAHQAYELALPRKDGGLRQTEVLTTLLAGADGHAALMVGVNRDITERRLAELQLRQAEELYRGIFEGAPMGIYRISPQGDSLAANMELARIFGYGSGEATLAAIMDSTRQVWGDPESRAHYWQQLDLNGEVRNLECEMRRSDGELIWVSINARAVPGPESSVQFYEGFVEDISERRRLELSIRENEQMLGAVFDHASVGIAYTDGTLGLQRTNRQLREMLECAEYDLKNGDFRRFVRQEDYAAIQAKVDEVRSGRVESFGLEMRFTRKEGTFFWGHLSVTVLRDKAGEPAGFVVIIDDVTERKEAREALIRFNQELEARVAARTAELAARTTEIEGLLDSIPDTVLLCDRQGTVLFSHLPRPEERPAVIDRWFVNGKWAGGDEDLLDLIREMRDAAQADGVGAVRDFEFPLNGHAVNLEARAVLIEADRMLIVLRDISARKQAERDMQANLERERQLSLMKSQFLTVASHEFRTPLAAALGSLELLERHAATISDTKRAELLARSQRSLNRLTAIINDVLNVSRAESGRVTVQHMAIDLPRFVRDVLREMETADRQEHRLVFAQTGGPEIVPTDSSLLHHIISNLVANALHYSPAGTTVSVTLALEREGFTLTVADEGIGVPVEDRSRIFEPFERGTNVGGTGGTGLGLNIVKRYAELLEGRIELLPTEKGAAFRVSIPTPPSASET